MTTHVAIGVSSWRDYQFLAPMTGVLWRNRIGFDPIFLLSGNWLDKKRGLVARTALHDLGFTCISMEDPEGILEATQAQNARQHAALLPLFNGLEDTWLIPSDADLWPIRKSYFLHHEMPHDRPVVSYYSNGDHGSTFPTCHIAMRVKDWRTLYPMTTPVWERQIEKSIQEWLPTRKFWKDDTNFALWMSDQAMMTDKIRAKYRPEEIKCIERVGHPPKDRIDRGCWPAEYQVEDFVDAHLPRPADQPENWPRVLALFSQLLPEYTDWAVKYQEAYIQGY